MDSKLPETDGSLIEQQQAKINFIRKSLGTLPEKLSLYCSDASIQRHLIARNWDVKKAMKMIKETLKWRRDYKPEEIRWEDIAKEGETGKIYRSEFADKLGRTILVMRPGRQNTKSTKGQIRYLVYCMENAVLNLPPHQEQMVWLIDFHGFNMSHISIKVTKETAHVLQDHYPERLGLAILFNAPKFFEPFWKLAKPFLDPKTCKKVKFVYSDDPESMKIMQDTFDVDKLECAFGGENPAGFDLDAYAQKMREDDKRMPLLWTIRANRGSPEPQAASAPDIGERDAEMGASTLLLENLVVESDESVKGSTHDASKDESDSDGNEDGNRDHVASGESDDRKLMAETERADFHQNQLAH